MDGNAIPACSLGPDQARVGGLQEFFRGGAVRWPAGNADGDSEPLVQPGGGLASRELRPDPLEDEQGLLARHVGQGDGELITADVSDERIRGQAGDEYALERPEDLVTSLRAVGLIEGAESVEVGHGDRYRQ